MIQAILIDDELMNVKNLQALLATHCKDVHVLATANNVKDAAQLLENYKPDVVFLDIEMPDGTGFDLLKSMRTIDFEVVFVSAFDSYGILAVKFSALDYILKPIDVKELKTSVENVKQAMLRKKQDQRMQNLLHFIDHNKTHETQKIALPTLKETHLVALKDIIRCESSNNYTTFYLKDGLEHIISKPLYSYEELLSPYGFIRCHQSHLVNKQHIKSLLNEDAGYLILNFTDKKIPISKLRKAEVKSMLNI